MTEGIKRIASERQRQLQDKRLTLEHDDKYYRGELAGAAGVYALLASGFIDPEMIMARRRDVENPVCLWPFGPSYYRPSDDKIRNLEKAGALIAAEIERLNRLEVRNKDATEKRP